MEPASSAARWLTPGTGRMLSWIRTIVAHGVRRPGSPQSLAVEHWLEAKLRELGLVDVRREPVPVNHWEPSTTVLAIPSAAAEVMCGPIPYTAWTSSAGTEAASAYVGQGSPAEFDRVDVRGRAVVFDAQFRVLPGALLKQQAWFVHDAEHSISDGPLPFARWLIENFSAYHEAARRGAAACVGLLSELPIDGCEYFVPYDGFLKPLPAVWVGRESADLVRTLAQASAVLRLVSLGETRTVNSHNVVGVVPGRGRQSGAATDHNLLITCHHDAPHASAVEDASGLAVVLELARRYAAAGEGPGSLVRDLVVVASSGHFHGGIGNRAFVERHAAGLLRGTAAAFGIEHIGHDVESDGHGGYARTGRPAARALFFDGSPEFRALVAEESARAALDRAMCLDAYLFGPEPPCDSAPYFTAGVPSLCHIAAPYYLFDPHDTLDKVCVADLPKVASLFASLLERVDGWPAERLSQGMKRPRGTPPAELPAWFRPPE